MALLYLVVFIFGLAVGSFLNAFLHRMHAGEKILMERSYCPHCRHKLSWQDLIPLLSFILLRGRCRYCQKPISMQYPLVELAAGLLFAGLAYSQLAISDGLFWMMGFWESSLWVWHLSYWFFIAGSLIAVFVYDLRHFLIPDKIIYPATVFVFLNRFLEAVSAKYRMMFGVNSFEFDILNLPILRDSGWDLERLGIPIAAGITVCAFFLAIVLISRGKWMGLGDVKLAFLMGLFLGFPNIAIAFFLAFFIGAVAGMALVVTKKKEMRSEVPFGPFLVTGTFIALFAGQQIIDWYWGLFL